MKFWDDIGDLSTFQRSSPIAYIGFHSEDIRH